MNECIPTRATVPIGIPPSKKNCKPILSQITPKKYTVKQFYPKQRPTIRFRWKLESDFSSQMFLCLLTLDSFSG